MTNNIDDRPFPVGTKISMPCEVSHVRQHSFKDQLWECYVEFDDPRGRGQWLLESVLAAALTTPAKDGAKDE